MLISKIWANIFSLIKTHMVLFLYHTDIAPILNSIHNQNLSCDLKLSIKDRKVMLKKKKKWADFLLFFFIEVWAF